MKRYIYHSSVVLIGENVVGVEPICSRWRIPRWRRPRNFVSGDNSATTKAATVSCAAPSFFLFFEHPDDIREPPTRRVHVPGYFHWADTNVWTFLVTKRQLPEVTSVVSGYVRRGRETGVDFSAMFSAAPAKRTSSCYPVILRNGRDRLVTR